MKILNLLMLTASVACASAKKPALEPVSPLSVNEQRSDDRRESYSQRFDLLSAINTGDRVTVERYCAEDGNLDVSRNIGEQDTAVHLAIRALIADYEKQVDHERLYNNMGIWTFAGVAASGLAVYSWPSLWAQLSQPGGINGALANLGSRTVNVLLLATLGGLMYWSAKQVGSNGLKLWRSWSQEKSAAERVKIVELLMAHQSFKPTAVNTDGQTPLALIQVAREQVTPDSVLDKVLQGLEAKLVPAQ